MNKTIRKSICAIFALTALTFAGCGAEQAESTFDNPLPWHDSASGSYERLDYTAAIYDTTKGGSESARVKIADGTVRFELAESADGFTRIDMSYTVTYTADAPAPDAGLTDRITSSVEFASNSLAARSMRKSLELADREGRENLSYTMDADYFDAHTATYLATKTANATPQTLALPQNTCRDNEMMFYIARAQGIGSNTSTMFRMVNVFDSFNSGSLTEYVMSVVGSEAKISVDVGDWVSAFGVPAVTNETTGETTYPVSCYETTIGINAEKHGPPYVVLYSENPFKQNGVEHAKIPVRISYSEYLGSAPRRCTEYTLSGCSFAK